MSKEKTLDELNEFLSMGGTKDNYTKKLLETRERLYRNDNLRLYIDTFVELEHERIGKSKEELTNDTYKLLALLVTEKFLALPEENYGKV